MKRPRIPTTRGTGKGGNRKTRGEEKRSPSATGLMSASGGVDAGSLWSTTKKKKPQPQKKQKKKKTTKTKLKRHRWLNKQSWKKFRNVGGSCETATTLTTSLLGGVGG